METDPRPLAAYRLLHHSSVLRLWLAIGRDLPEWEGAETGVPAALAEMQESLLTLAEIIPANLYTELKAILVHGRQIADDGDSRREQSQIQALGEQVQSLARRALRNSPYLAAWAELGAVIGEAEVKLYGNGRADVAEVLRRILAAVKGLPAEAEQASPVLGKLAKVSERKGAAELVKLIQQGIGPGRDWPEGDEGEEGLRHCAAVTVGGVNVAIVEVLRTLSGSEAAVMVEEDNGENLRPGHMGLILIENRHEVRRVGFQESVEFGGKVVLWRLLEALWRRGPAFFPKDELIRAVWGDAMISDNAFWSAMGDVRESLEPLNVRSTHNKGLGYRLEEPGLEGRGW